MMRTHPFAWMLMVTAVLLAGCQDIRWGSERQKAVTPATTADAGADQEPVVAEDQAAADDPHRQEMMNQVREFVDRLEPGETAVAEATPSPEAAIPEPVEEPQQPPAPTARVNMPFDVNDIQEADDLTAAAPPARVPVKPVVESVFIRGGAPDIVPESEDETVSTTNTSLCAAETPHQALSVEELIAALAGQVQEHPGDTAAQWQLRLLQLAIGDEEAARNMPDDTGDGSITFMTRLIEAIIASRSAMENPMLTAQDALEPVRTLYNTIQERADLQIPTVALCTRVQTFGVYDEMPDDALLANRANRTIVYMEIDNFMSEQSNNGQFRTVLSGELEVLTPSGQVVWHHEEPEIVDLSRQRRRDFFLAQMVTLPNTLGPGEYVLKISIQDELSGKSTQAVHSFALGGAATVHASNL